MLVNFVQYWAKNNKIKIIQLDLHPSAHNLISIVKEDLIIGEFFLPFPQSGKI